METNEIIIDKFPDIAVAVNSIPCDASTTITGVSYNAWERDHSMKYHPHKFIKEIEEHLLSLEKYNNSKKDEYIQELIKVKKDLDNLIIKYI